MAQISIFDGPVIQEFAQMVCSPGDFKERFAEHFESNTVSDPITIDAMLRREFPTLGWSRPAIQEALSRVVKSDGRVIMGSDGKVTAVVGDARIPPELLQKYMITLLYFERMYVVCGADPRHRVTFLDFKVYSDETAERNC